MRSKRATARLLVEETSTPRLNVGYTALPADIKKEVRAYAKAGKPHPDPTVASSALSWARGFQPRRALAFDVLMTGVEVVLGLLDGTPAFTFTTNYAERRTAKRLLDIERHRMQRNPS